MIIWLKMIYPKITPLDRDKDQFVMSVINGHFLI
jgi:hypothetical protein